MHFLGHEKAFSLSLSLSCIYIYICIHIQHIQHDTCGSIVCSLRQGMCRAAAHFLIDAQRWLRHVSLLRGGGFGASSGLGCSLQLSGVPSSLCCSLRIRCSATCTETLATRIAQFSKSLGLRLCELPLAQCTVQRHFEAWVLTGS